MMVILDISKPFQSKPGVMKYNTTYRSGFRVWWLFFAVTYSPLNDHDYYERVASGKTEWTRADSGELK